MKGRSIEDAINRRQRESDPDGGERYTDMAIDFELDGELLLATGGRWDRRLHDFDGPAEAAIVVRIHAGQRRAVEWFSSWLTAHDDRRENPPRLTAEDLEAFAIDLDPAHSYSAMFAGGRRGGKTWIAVALSVAYAVRYPGAIVWLTSPIEGNDSEIRRYVAGVLPSEWIDRETASDGWELCNGSLLVLKGAYDPDVSLKDGEANLVLLNEGQKMKARAFTLARGAIVDKAGLVLVCANPPVEAKDQQWVTDFAADAAAGRRAAVFLLFDPLLNPHIDRAALLSLKSELDARTYAIEVRGEFLGPKDAVAYNWVRLENEGPTPLTGDVTSQFLSMIEEGDGIKQVVGLDVQRIPHIGGPIYRFFGDPGRGRVLAWIVGEVVLEGGDEVDFCGGLEDAGLHPDETLIICDASGQWQHSRRRNSDAPPPEWKGRGSFDMIRGEGWRRIKPPDPRQHRNPAIQDRMRAFTSMIDADGRRRLFCDPAAAPKVCKAIRDWRTVNGAPSRTQHEAHLGDAASYPIIRFFPRVLRSSESASNPRAMDKGVSKVDLVSAIPASPAELRISPPSRGPTHTRRGVRGRGM